MTKTKARQLRDMIQSSELEFLMEAHNGVSAKIAERTGFKGLWASGLCLSTSYGIRDRNEASWTQVLETVEFMADATDVPILLDGDTGYGDFNNVARLVKKLCQRDVAGVCIEDKLFPKQNSFLGDAQPLLTIPDFTAKIRAAKDAQSDPDFIFVARVEALIAGRSMQEALDRAGAYRQAGADAILIHSKKADSKEIEEFCRQWDNACPVVIVPTKYHQTPMDVFRDLGVSTTIWANHAMRAAIVAISEVCEEIYRTQSISAVEQKVATLTEVFDLTGENVFDDFVRKVSA
ncbi:phosphoenolpyruvate mutase [Oceanicola sp. 22II-s10i]|uniref:phosphoenolpyruvate mutase n=1 Tax=Oceanicola sp. 22II-s10i TaxID=1317116 RepID=UPI000B523E51|nr:phosphoenolpyruvate mutase [Oceanicola sp. 22II-s10i]